MNRRQQKKVKAKYLRKIENLLQDEDSNPWTNSHRIGYLIKLGDFVRTIDYPLFVEVKYLFPNGSSLNNTEEIKKVLSNNLIQREIAFKELDI